MHLCFLNQSNESSETKQFVAEQKFRQTQWREELGVQPEQAESAYQFMKWCDRLSLILCQNKIPDNHRELEINQGADGITYYISRSQAEYLTVNPWCFARDKFTVKVEASYLSQIEFADNQSLTKALKTAPRKYLEWTFVKTKIEQEKGMNQPKSLLKAA